MKYRIVKLKIDNKIRYKVENYTFGNWGRYSTAYLTLWGAKRFIKFCKKLDNKAREIVIEVIDL